MSIDEVKKLSPDEINQMIAEALYPRFCDGQPPDYFHDLNACQSAFDSLSPVIQMRIIHHLHWYNEEKNQPDKVTWWKLFYCTTADVRAIALAVVLSERLKYRQEK